MDESLLDAVAEERRRGNTYKLLSECFHEPDEQLLELLDELASEDLYVSTEDLRDSVSDLDAMRVEYAKLFVGPFELQAPPYESTYVDNPERVMTESTAEVMDLYRREGLEIGREGPADHVSAELEFVYVLVRREIEALGTSDRQVATEYLQRQYDFLVNHLGRWAPEFTENVIEHTDSEFYRLLASDLQSFVETDGKRLSDRHTRLDDEGVTTVLENEVG